MDPTSTAEINMSRSQVHITSENSEDTFDSADSLEEAIRIAKEGDCLAPSCRQS
jgi:hypothetical protein